MEAGLIDLEACCEVCCSDEESEEEDSDLSSCYWRPRKVEKQISLAVYLEGLS